MDRLAPEQRSRLMARIRGRDTGPELFVRSFLHRRGLRFRLHVGGLPGRPDLVLPRYRAAIFVHGCFWHGHTCRAGSVRPKTNARFWAEKLARNRERDRRSIAALRRAGWRVLVVWECSLRDADRLEARIGRWLAGLTPIAKSRGGAPASRPSRRSRS
jgi:DNA mismatch endonuclease (patch repair protein)